MSTKIDRMRFQLNHLSYRLGFLGFLIYIVYVATTLDFIPKKMTMGLEIIIDLFFFMILFLGLEKIKNYSVKWSIYVILLGISTLLRVFWHPLVLVNLQLQQYAWISGVSITLAGILITISGIIGYRKSNILLNYLNQTDLKLNNLGHNANGIKKEKK